MSSMSLEEYRAAQDAEYSAFVATETIFIDGARAFNVGDPVPAGHVKRGVVDKSQVAKPEVKAAQADPTPKGEKAPS